MTQPPIKEKRAMPLKPLHKLATASVLALTFAFNGTAYGIIEKPHSNLLCDATGQVKAAPANDTAIKAAKDALDLGAKMADGSVFAGLTADGRQQIFAMPADLGATLNFNDTAKSVKELNAKKALGHNDWTIPTENQLNALQKNQDKGALKGTFNTTNKKSGSDYPDWYWSSTELRDDPSYVWGVRFSDGFGDWGHKDFHRLSCRPVRLVPTSPPAARS